MRPSDTLPPNDTLYNVTEVESLHIKETQTQAQETAQALSSKYKRAIEQEHTTDLISQATETVFRNAAVLAASQIVSLAVHSSSPSTRLKASQYVVDRVLGPIGKTEAAGDKFAELLMAVSSGQVTH